jgi:hypothetical protein
VDVFFRFEKKSAGGRGDYVFFKGAILGDIPDTARFLRDR